MRARTPGRRVAAVASWALLFAPAADALAQAQPPPAAPASADARERAKEHFERGLRFYEQSAWEPALAEFLTSREQLATRSATKNAALCLKNLGRHDEALEMFEALLREFSDLSEADRSFADRAIAELSSLVGRIELRGVPRGASVTVEARTVAAPAGEEPYALRVNAGTRVVRVHKDGFTPFEARPVVLAGKITVLEVRMTALGRAGTLRVAERSGKRVDVVVDGAVVGQTPWEGPVAPGRHTVLLRGPGIEGSQPMVTSVRPNQTTPIGLYAEELPSVVRVEPSPATAEVSIDGVPVGVGNWEGRLRAGRHRVEVEADGYQPGSYQIELDEREQEVVTADLRRVGQPAAVEASGAKTNRVLFELIAAGALTSSFGGVTEDAGGVAAGGMAVLHAGYELRSGLCFGLLVGGLALSQSREDRGYSVTPVGELPDEGSVDDDLALRGVLFGATGGLHLGDRFPGLFRVGIGGLVGSVTDQRRGTFQSDTGASYDTGTLEHAASAGFLFVAPEARIGFRFAEHFELSAGVAAMILIALGTPRWENDELFRTDAGAASFEDEDLTGGAIVVLTPGVGLRYDF